MCELCDRTEQKEGRLKILYQDEVCWVTLCKTHNPHLLVVLNRHVREPSVEEEQRMRDVANIAFPDKKWIASNRNPSSTIPEHFHLHETR